MKIRSGFVSNSSSSSFIIKVDKSEKFSIEMTMDEFIDLVAKSSDYNDSGVDRIITNIDELNSYFENYYDLDSIEELFAQPDNDENAYSLESTRLARDSYTEYLNDINAGKKIIIGGVDYNDRFLSDLLVKIGADVTD